MEDLELADDEELFDVLFGGFEQQGGSDQGPTAERGAAVGQQQSTGTHCRVHHGAFTPQQAMPIVRHSAKPSTVAMTSYRRRSELPLLEGQLTLLAQQYDDLKEENNFLRHKLKVRAARGHVRAG